MIPPGHASSPAGDPPAVRALRRVAAGPLSPESMEAFAAALAVFGLDARGLGDLDEAEWDALAARALRAGGEAVVTAAPAADALRAERVVAVIRSPPLRRLARRGIVRPAVRHPASPSGAWAVNVDRLCGEDGALELGVRRKLGDVIAELSEVCGGDPPPRAVALEGLGRLARRLVGPDAGAARIRQAAEDVRRFCAEALECQRSARGWNRAPDVLRLDLAG